MTVKKIRIPGLVLDTGLQVKEGIANARMGGGTLVAGTATITNSSMTATTRVFLTRTGGTSTGQLRHSGSVVGTSFTVTSTDGADTGTFNWLLIESSP